MDESAKIYPEKKKKDNGKGIVVSKLKELYICDELTAEAIADRYGLSVSQVERYIKLGKWGELRTQYAKKGAEKLKNEQLNFLEDLMDIEAMSTQLKIAQLRQTLSYHVKYYQQYGDLFKRSYDGQIITDEDGIPIRIHIPNVSKDLDNIKKSLQLSDGLLRVLEYLETIKPDSSTTQQLEGSSEVNIDKFSNLFEK